jgi:hypothetical protein
MAGTVAGAGIDVLAPHQHRSDDSEQRRVWVGFRPANELEGEGGGVLHISGALWALASAGRPPGSSIISVV